MYPFASFPYPLPPPLPPPPPPPPPPTSTVSSNTISTTITTSTTTILFQQSTAVAQSTSCFLNNQASTSSQDFATAYGYSGFYGNQYYGQGNCEESGYYEQQRNDYYGQGNGNCEENGCYQEEDGYYGQGDGNYEQRDDYYEQQGDGNYEQGDDYYEGEENGDFPEKQKMHFCELCNVYCSGDSNYRAHLDGKNHAKRVGGATTGNRRFNNKNPAYRCDICNVNCSSLGAYHLHSNGQKHQRAIKGMIKANKPIPTNDGTIVLPDASANKRKAPETVQNPVLDSAMEDINDEYIVEKLDQISLNKTQKNAIEQLVDLVEDALSAVSKIIGSPQRGGRGGSSSIPGTSTLESEDARLLRGIMRAGHLANQLLLINDAMVNLIVLCSLVPTTDLFFHVLDLFIPIVKRGEQNLTHHGSIFVNEDIKKAAFSVSQNGIPMEIVVTFTCSSIRKSSNEETTNPDDILPPNCLPREACLRALAEMRRTKFYQVKCASFEWMAGVVKIVREFSNRIPAWSPLNDWMIILLIEKVFSSHAPNNNKQFGPSAALGALFTAISEGQILGQDSKLFDPCEKLPTDVLASVTSLERKQLFASARYAIRQINAGRMAKLLALEGDGVPSSGSARKKARSSGGSSETSSSSSFSSTPNNFMRKNSRMGEEYGATPTSSQNSGQLAFSGSRIAPLMQSTIGGGRRDDVEFFDGGRNIYF